MRQDGDRDVQAQMEMMMKILSRWLTAIGEINLKFDVNSDHRFTLTSTCSVCVSSTKSEENFHRPVALKVATVWKCGRQNERDEHQGMAPNYNN